MKTFAFYTLFFSSLSIFAQPVIKASVENATCKGRDNGSIRLQISGISPFKFLWNDGSSDAERLNLSPGTYQLNVTDANGRNTGQIFTVNADLTLLVNNESTNGQLSVQVSGGQIPYTYIVSYFSKNGNQEFKQTNPIFTGLAKRRYVLDVVDANGCVATTTVEVK